VVPATAQFRRLIPAAAGSLAVAALPKCPLCLLAWAGVAGSAGFASTYGAWLLPGTAALLALTVLALALSGRTRGFGPAALALAASAAVLIGKFGGDRPPLLYAGLAALAAAALWGGWPRPAPAEAHACAPCASTAVISRPLPD
jgi:4-amino-4-deoxy-L-arabinose transferase-like glycosyltransferase